MLGCLVATQHSDKRANLIERRLRNRANIGNRLFRCGRVQIDEALRRCRLNGDRRKGMRRDVVHFARDAHALVSNAARSELLARSLSFSQAAARLFHIGMVHAHAETAQGGNHYKRNVFDAHHKRHGDARSAHRNHRRAHAHHSCSRKSLAAGAFACHGIDSHDGTYGRKRNRSAHGIRQEGIACKREREHEPRCLTTKNQRRSRKGNRQIRINIRDVINPARPIRTSINVHNRRSGDNHLGAAKREGDKGDGNVDSPIGRAAILGRGAFFQHPAKNTARRDVVLHKTGEVFLAGSIELRMGRALCTTVDPTPNASLGAIVGPASNTSPYPIFSTAFFLGPSIASSLALDATSSLTVATIVSMACGSIDGAAASMARGPFADPVAMQRGPHGARRA